jgi:hypothetical protein
MNEDARKYMRSALTTLDSLCKTLESASKAAGSQNIKSRIDAQVSNLKACLDECDHIEDNISRY